MTVVVMDTKPVEEKEERPVAAEGQEGSTTVWWKLHARSEEQRDPGSHRLWHCRNVGMQGTFTNRCASRTAGREERRRASRGRSATFGRVAGERHPKYPYHCVNVIMSCVSVYQKRAGAASG